MSNECLITTLCGSTRHKQLIEMFAANLERSGHFIVFRSQFFAHADKITLTDEEIETANDLHRFKIRMSNAIHVVDPGGYLGESTKDEISYALFNEKDIYIMSMAGGAYDTLLDIARKIPAKIRAKYKYHVDVTPGSVFPYAYCIGDNKPIFV